MSNFRQEYVYRMLKSLRCGSLLRFDSADTYYLVTDICYPDVTKYEMSSHEHEEVGCICAICERYYNDVHVMLIGPRTLGVNVKCPVYLNYLQNFTNIDTPQ